MNPLLLSALLWLSGGDKPMLRIELDAKRNSTLTVVSRVPWTLSRSTDLRTWEPLTSGKPAAAGLTQIFTGIDYVWGHGPYRAFYRVQALTNPER